MQSSDPPVDPEADVETDPDRTLPELHPGEDDSTAAFGEESRPYIWIRPSDDPVSPETVRRQFTRLYDLCRTAVELRLRHKLLRRRPDPPLIEWLLVSTGGPDSAIEYYVSTDGDDDVLDALERTLRMLFPGTYEFERVDFHPATHLRVDPERDDLHAVAVEYLGEAARRGDWQTAMESFDPTGTDTGSDAETRVALAAVAETMAESPAPMAYQVVMRPLPDWTRAAQNRILDIEAGAETWGEKLVKELIDGFFLGESDREPSLTEKDERRIEEIRAREKPCSFVANIRAVAVVPHGRHSRRHPSDSRPAGKSTNGGVESVDDLSRSDSARTESRSDPPFDPDSDPDSDPAFDSDFDPDPAFDSGFDPDSNFEFDFDSDPDFADSPASGSNSGRPTPADATRAIRDIATVLAPTSGETHKFESAVYMPNESRRLPGGRTARRVLKDLYARELYPPEYERLYTRLPGTKNRSRGIVVDVTEVPNACLLSGEGLTPLGHRSIAPTPSERTAVELPPPAQLEHYRTDGFTIGRPITSDAAVLDEIISLVASLQTKHSLITGNTGSGKTILLLAAILANRAATPGASIIVDQKGDGMAEDYLRAHYKYFGNLDDVMYFDAIDILPAICQFTIEDQLDAGIPRDQAVQDVTDHYLEQLETIVGRERFQRAITSDDVLTALIKALFDPVHGSEAFSHADLAEAVRRMDERRSTPAVSNEETEDILQDILSNDQKTFTNVMNGAKNRIRKISIDDRLATVFNHVPDEDGPNLDLIDHLDRDVTIIFDLGSLHTDGARGLILVLLSNLWIALKRRKQRADPGDDLPVVNLYLEEAARFAATDLLKELLSESRGFGVGITIAMQYPGQLRVIDEGTYEEVLNEVSTVVAGKIPYDPKLAARLATDDCPSRETANRLRALRRGQWYVSLPAPFGEPEPRPFYVESVPPPPGHPESDEPLTRAEEIRFQHAFARVRERTLERYGIGFDTPATTDAEAHAEPADPDIDADEEPMPRIDTALRYTKRMPPTVDYDTESHSLVCNRCETRYDPSIDGMKRAIECCSSLDDVDRDDIPLCGPTLKLTPEERAQSGWPHNLLLFLQAVQDAHGLRWDPLEYDLLRDSMILMQSYLDVSSDEIDELIDAGLLRIDSDHPYRLYSLTPDGRAVINEGRRKGVDFGHGKGDLDETTEHVLQVELLYRYIVAEYEEDPDSPVETVTRYFELDDGHRLDAVGLDADGNIVIAGEAERINNDLRTAVPEDFDKIASCDPEEAVWVVRTRQDAHDILDALNDPLDGEPRLENAYSRNTAPQDIHIKGAPGLSLIFTVEHLRNRLVR